MIRRPPRSTPFPTRRSSDLGVKLKIRGAPVAAALAALLVAAPIAAAHVTVNPGEWEAGGFARFAVDRKSTRLNSSHANISYAVFCLKKKKKHLVFTSIMYKS